MPSNSLALGLYERGISKRTFQHTTGFCRFREEERRRLSKGDNFLQQPKRSGVSRVCGEKVAAARTEKLGTHSHTHTLTHSHTHTLTHRTTAIPSLANAYARVITIYSKHTHPLKSHTYIYNLFLKPPPQQKGSSTPPLQLPVSGPHIPWRFDHQRPVSLYL